MSERFVTPCDLPTEHERELLHILIEEAAEVQQRATKMLRFGRDEVQPGQESSNCYRLSAEIGDFIVTCDMARAAGLVRTTAVEEGKVRKRAQLAKFMQTTE